MYVVWRRREKIKRGEVGWVKLESHYRGGYWGYLSQKTGRWFKTAALVESFRPFPSTTPRVRHFCYLGRFEEGTEDDPSVQREFWGRAITQLEWVDKLKDRPRERERIETALAKIMPKPSEEEIQWYRTQAAKSHAKQRREYKEHMARIGMVCPDEDDD
jgi:hypothetical protein